MKNRPFVRLLFEQLNIFSLVFFLDSSSGSFLSERLDRTGAMGPRTAVTASKEVKVVMGGARLRSSSDGSRYSRRELGLRSNNNSSSSSSVLSSPKSVLKRPVSTEELQQPGGPYVRRTFTIVGDAVGWGFVVRGNRPCHIQAVEPCGPAAAAGMKVCQFVVSVNGHNVLDLDYRSVSHLILTGPRTVVMEVMEETDH